MFEEHNGAIRPRVTVLVLVACSVAIACAPSASVPSTSATPSPYLTASPPPTREAGFARLRGVVTDGSSGTPLADVCVVIATGGSCQPASPRTDSAGFWWIDLPVGIDWDVAWTKDGYEPVKRRLHTDPGEQIVHIELKSSR